MKREEAQHILKRIRDLVRNPENKEIYLAIDKFKKLLDEHFDRAEIASTGELMLYAESGLSGESFKGFVKISEGIGWAKTISPGEARMFALSILEAAEGANTDEIFWTWLDTIGVTSAQAKYNFLMQVRAQREKVREG